MVARFAPLELAGRIDEIETKKQKIDEIKIEADKAKEKRRVEKQTFILREDILYYFNLVADRTLPIPRRGLYDSLRGFVKDNEEEALEYRRKVEKQVKAAIVDVANKLKIEPEEYKPMPSVEFLTIGVPEGSVDFAAAYDAEMQQRSPHGAIILTPHSIGHLPDYYHEGGHFLRENFHPRKADGSDLLVSEFFGSVGEHVYSTEAFGSPSEYFSAAFADKRISLEGHNLSKDERIKRCYAHALAAVAVCSDFKSGIYVDDLVRRPTEQVERELRFQIRRFSNLAKETYGDPKIL